MAHIEITLSECSNPEPGADPFDSWWVTLYENGCEAWEAWCYVGEDDCLADMLAQVQDHAGGGVPVRDYRYSMPVDSSCDS